MYMPILPASESEKVEFKTSYNEDVIESLVAFSNTKGGTVYIGISDSSEIRGIQLGKETTAQCINEIKNKTAPQIIPDIDILNIQGKDVVLLSVKEYPIKPVSTRGRYYKRVQNSNHLLSVDEISDVYMQSMQNSWDSYPYRGATTNSLNIEKIEQFIAKVNIVKRFSLPTQPLDALKKLNLIRFDVPANAAMLLFSNDNLRYNVHIGRFKTPSTIIADKMISGNLYDVLEESFQTIIEHLKFAVEITGKTTQHIEIPEYP